MSIILSQDDLFRMRESTLPVIIDHSKNNRKAELKRLSEDKIKNWPNTLEAMRIKKEQFMKDRADADELRRQEIDRQEAEIRRQERMKTIDKANKLLYSQTDKMKFLTSQIAYADCIHTRVSQVELRKKQEEEEKKIDVHYHELKMTEVKKGDAAEQAKIDRKKEVVKEVAIMREQQVKEVRSKREAEAEVARQIGLEMKADAIRQLEQAAQEMRDRQAYIAKCNADTLVQNEKLRIIRDETRQKVIDEIAAKEGEKDIIENRKKAIKALQIRLFEKQQETKQKLIDAAVEQLSRKQNGDNALLNKQMDEIRAREEKKEGDKAAARQSMKDAIEKSRQEQVDKKEIEWKRNHEEETTMLKKWAKENEDAIQAEKDKVTRAAEAVKKLKAIQYAEASAKHKKRVEDKIAQTEEERLMFSLSGEDDEMFKEVAYKTIDDFKSKGKPTYNLYKALETTAQPLLPAKTDKSKRGKKKE